MIVLAYPWFLLIAFLPFIIHKFFPPVKGLYGDALKVPFLKDIVRINNLSGSLWKSPLIGREKSKRWFLLYLVWLLLTVAASRPQIVSDPMPLKNYGRNIFMVTDISNSMQTPDFSYQGKRIDRLTAIKIAASNFIRERRNDRIGLILFGTRAYLQSPATFDKQAVLDILLSADAGMAGNSTAIGDAVGLALKTLRAEQSSDSGKIIILLTDGENNDGSLSMPEVIKIAKTENVKIYTIGIGSENQIIDTFFGIRIPQTDAIDETDLRQLANETKGNYFRASDTKGLQQIYQEIDSLEPSLNEDRFVQERKDLFFYPLALGLIVSFMFLRWQKRRA